MPLGLMVSLWVLAQISRRFGEVTHRPPLYRGFYVAFGLMLFPLLIRLLAIGLSEAEIADLGGNSTETLLHDIPLAVGVILAVIIAWRYWGWLVYTSEDITAMNPSHSPSQPKHRP